MINECQTILQSEFGIIANDISPVSGGWSASAFRVHSIEKSFFLKVYDKKRSSIANLLPKLDLCMQIASWLEHNTELQGRINAPLLTKQGKVNVETQEYVYMLFNYIDGITIETTPLFQNQQSELAEIVGILHRQGTNLPFDLSDRRETFTIPCADLLEIPSKMSDPPVIYQNRDLILQAIGHSQKLANQFQAENENIPFVLCHTDIHGWNLMQSDKLILIDWETIKLAPAEADLYSFWGDWYWGNAKWGSYWETFLPTYQRLRSDYIVRDDLLHFYQVRRHIEDINDFYKQYLYDNMSEVETREVIWHLERECAFLSSLLD